MTSQRQENKDRGLNRAFKIAVFAALTCFAGLMNDASAGITERVVINRHTGLAIDGFDPVAYFVEKELVAGSAEIEWSDRGAVWRFRNDGNRAAFMARPDVYSPKFGGYDPVDVARGKPVAGRAQFWLIHEDRLYLFNREDNRAAFAAAPERVVEQALERWPDVLKNLSDY